MIFLRHYVAHDENQCIKYLFVVYGSAIKTNA